MPFINSNVSVKTTVKQRQELKERLGQMFPDMKVEIHDAIDI